MANVREIWKVTARSWVLSLPYVTPITSRDERCRYNRGMTHDSLYDEGLVETVLAAQALATAEEADRISDLLMRYMVLRRDIPTAWKRVSAAPKRTNANCKHGWCSNRPAYGNAKRERVSKPSARLFPLPSDIR